MSEVQYCNQLKPDYIGFVFAPGRHQITPQHACQLSGHVIHSTCVGVFVNESCEQIVQLARLCRLSVIQLHGEESEQDIQYVKAHTSCTIWKALRVRTQQDIQQSTSLHPDRFLLDRYLDKENKHPLDRTLLQGVDVHAMILAGGITTANIMDYLTLSPYGIDISSGIETDGHKDYAKMKKIIEEVRT